MKEVSFPLTLPTLVGICLLALIPPLSASAGEGPRPASPAGKIRQAFEYIERLEIAGAEVKLSVASSTIVLVIASRDGLVAELRPSPGRSKTQPGDPTPGKASILAAKAGEPVEVDLEPIRVELGFDPHAAALLAVEGLPRKLADEARAVLGQGPPANPLRSDAVVSYEIGLWSGGKPVALRGEQRNGKLWMDWTLTGAGTFDVGRKGWELPVEFILPAQEVRPALTLHAEAGMRYSSSRSGPAKETTLDVTAIASSGAAQVKYRRTCELRPIALRVADVTPLLAKEIPVRTRLGPHACDWARTATLATLGVQRLPGVRETGIGMWLAQVAIDCLAGPVARRMKDEAARSLLSDIARLSPELSPPPVLADEPQLGFRPAGRWTLRGIYFPVAELTGAQGDGDGSLGELTYGFRLGRVDLHLALAKGSVDVTDERTRERNLRDLTGVGVRMSVPSGWRFQAHFSIGWVRVKVKEPFDPVAGELVGDTVYEAVALSYALNRRFSLEAHYRRFNLSYEALPPLGPLSESVDLWGLGLAFHF